MNKLREPASQTCFDLCIQVGKRLYKWFNRRLEQLGLTPVQLQVLAALADHEALRMSELGEQLCCVGSNITAVIGRMADAGWVERRPDPGDRRVRSLRITRKGRALLASATHTPRCCPEAARWLRAGEWAQFRRMLRKLESHLDAAGDQAQGGGRLPGATAPRRRDRGAARGRS